ncbi:MAG: hypothetical protein LBJ03_02990 [Holosporales bacterium]|jgi:hypothetical protein|nr:hypothetical protein [Holosporales bacterium]
MLGFVRILLVLCFWPVGSGALEAYASTVAVKDVFVKAEDKSATKAKDQALRKGEALAVLEAAQAMAEPHQNINDILSSIRSPSAYVSDFTINEEKITPTAYEAFVTYRLAKDRLIKLLVDKGVKLKPEAERIASIRAKDLYGKEVVIESLGDASGGRPRRAPSDSDKSFGRDNGAEPHATVIKIRTHSVKDWLDLSPVLANFFESTTVYVSANLTILEASNIVIDDNLIKAVSERGFSLTVLPDKTVVVSIKEALAGDREANTAPPPSSVVSEAGIGHTI